MAAYKRRRSFKPPRPSKRRKVYKRSRRVSRRRYSRVQARVSRAISAKRAYGFGEQKVVYCRWTGKTDVTISAGVYISNTFLTPVELTSAYDPCKGATGDFNVTAAGFDLHARIYRRYVVLGAKLVAVIRNSFYTATDVHRHLLS